MHWGLKSLSTSFDFVRYPETADNAMEATEFFDEEAEDSSVESSVNSKEGENVQSLGYCTECSNVLLDTVVFCTMAAPKILA